MFVATLGTASAEQEDNRMLHFDSPSELGPTYASFVEGYAKAGPYTVLVKIASDAGVWACSVRLTDTAGNPVSLPRTTWQPKRTRPPRLQAGVVESLAPPASLAGE